MEERTADYSTNLVNTVQVGDNVKSDVRVLVLEEDQEEREQVLYGFILPDDGRESHDYRG